MDAVKEFRKLLNIDLAKFNFSNFSDIKELNKQSYKIGNVLNGIEDDYEENLNNHKEKSSLNDKTIQLDDVPIKNPLNKQGVQSFEELLNRTLQNGNHTDSNHKHDSSVLPSKKPFLRRGEGLKRYQNASKPLSNTIEKVQETRRCIKALNLRNENKDKERVFNRKVLSIPQQTKPKQVVNSNREPSFSKQQQTIAKTLTNSHQNEPDHDSELIKKFSALLQAQNELKKDNFGRRKLFESDSIPGTNMDEDPHARKKNIVEKIDQLEQRLLYLLNLKSNLMSTPLDACENSKKHVPSDDNDSHSENDDCREKDGYNDDDEDDDDDSDDVRIRRKKHKPKKDINSSLQNLKKEIVSLNDKIVTMKLRQQEEQIEKYKILQKESIENEILKNILKKNQKNDEEKKSSKNSNEDDREVLSIPVKTLDGQKDAKTVVYKHKNGSISTIFPTGMKVIQYQNGQIEKIYPDSTKQIIYPDNQQKIIHPDNSEELHLSDGRIYSMFCDGTEKMQYPNGDYEIKTKDYTKRHFANGNIKTVYSNGYQETIYSNGRIRLKDNHGNVLCDKRC